MDAEPSATVAIASNPKARSCKRAALMEQSFVYPSLLAGTHFPNQGDFARYYQRQFGELPSQTLARQRR